LSRFNICNASMQVVLAVTNH